jgi:hypothetical protein
VIRQGFHPLAAACRAERSAKLDAVRPRRGDAGAAEPMLPRAKPPKGGDAEPRDYRGDVSPSRQPSRQRPETHPHSVRTVPRRRLFFALDSASPSRQRAAQLERIE